MFFDDYANALISGASMRPIADKNNISPALIAYMIDTIASVASIMLISTWAAFEASLMFESASMINLNKTANQLFIGSLPYHFFTYLAIFLTLIVAYTGKWFGSRIDNITFKTNQSQLVIGTKTKSTHVALWLGNR